MATSVTDERGHFYGFSERECGEHRTVGSHRAWCHGCGEWCYPSIPCRGCELPMLRAVLKGLIDAASCMPDAGLDDSDPRRAWWFNVLAPARDRALQALGF